MDFSSRMKDYYDIYFLLHNFDFDGIILCKALQSTFANRQRIFLPVQFEQFFLFKDNPDMRKKWKLFAKKIEFTKEDFAEIINDINIFLFEPFLSAVQNTEFSKKWNIRTLSWN